MKRGFLAFLALWVLIPLCSAQTQDIPRITPVAALGTDIASVARASEQMAEGQVTGGGRWLRIAYASPTPLVGLVVPFTSATAYNPVDMLRFELPASAGAAVDIDLSVSTSWNASLKTYMVSFAAAANDAAPTIGDVAIMPAAFGDSLRAGFLHAFSSEQLVVSTYHMLRGYRVLGHGVVPVLAIAFFAVCALIVLRKKATSTSFLFAFALVAQLLYGARVGIDQLRLSGSHLSSWFTTGAYAEAGDTYALADAVNALPGDVRLAVCFDSTDYFAKLLRYLLLPIPVQIGTDGPMRPTHVAVVRKIGWTFVDGRLGCGTINAPATLLKEFPDGSRLFQL